MVATSELWKEKTSLVVCAEHLQTKESASTGRIFIILQCSANVFIVRKIYSPVGITVFSPLPHIKQIVAQILGVLHLLKTVT